MNSHLRSQGTGLVQGVNAFEPYINRLHSDYEKQKFIDWPTIIFATTLQSSAVSIFKLLPNVNEASEILDKRSIATLVRNVVDTHDVISMMVGPQLDSDRWNLHRDILGLYLCGRINKVQKFTAPEHVQRIFPHTRSYYWQQIKSSPLYTKRMLRLKKGEQVFYRTRRERVEAICGEDTEFVLGVLADLSTFVHSIPAALWFKGTGDLFQNKKSAQDTVAVWLRITNFYLAKSFSCIIDSARYELSVDMGNFVRQYDSVFD